MKKVAIGGGQGFWGDSPDAAIDMIRNADIQYMGIMIFWLVSVRKTD